MILISNGELRISVRNLVEFLCREGDLDNRNRGVSDKTAMEAGSKVHRRIQKAMGPDYQAEVSMKMEIPQALYKIIIEGRADGIFIQDGIVTIDEIKGTYADIRYFQKPVAVHRAQAMCYAYFYMMQHDLDRIGIRMTYINLDYENIRYFEETFGRQELTDWFEELMTELKKWGDFVVRAKEERNRSIQGLAFPFPYRKGQRELAVSVYKAVQLKRHLFIQAPTGVGKTISTVYPSVMAVGENQAEKIFYLTAKTITRTAAQEAFMVLRQKGLKFRTVTVTAKEKICFLESETGPECNPAACMFAKGHFDRVNDAVYDLITHEEVISRQTIEQYAKKHQVCPFEFCLDVTYWMDGIICDYNYAFDPHVHLKRFFQEGVKGDYIFLIDEAHNLVDRARGMYSAEIIKEDILAAKKLVSGKDRKLAAALERCNKNLLSFKRLCETEYRVLEEGEESVFSLNMMRLQEELTRFMEQNRDFAYLNELSEFFFTVMHYNDMQEHLDENYVVYTEHTDRGFMLRLFCVNPAVNLNEYLSRGRCGIFFSATLLPINYYKELLSGNKEDYAIYAHSPFDPRNRLLMIANDVTSRYTKRNETEYRKIWNYIFKALAGKNGNYLVFFPSYQYMLAVYELWEQMDKETTADIVVQKNNMTEEEKEQFLERFSGQTDRTLVGFCVMGGSFSEGIDLKKEQLIGTVIVGTGLPSLNTASQILRAYYDEKENCGYEYAYVYPGMNKVLQAAGRVIRTDEDQGIILLLDDRFLTNQYQSLFPLEWSDYRVVRQNNVGEEILDFWEDMKYNVD